MGSITTLRAPIHGAFAFVMLFVTTSVGFDAPASPAPRATLSGTLFVPEGWPSRLTLRIHPVNLRGSTDADTQHIPLARMIKQPGREGWYRWSSGSLQPAQYTLDVHGTGFVTTVELAPVGNRRIELVLAEPATLLVHLVDEASKASVNVGVLAWLSNRDPDGSYSLNGSIEIDPEEGATTYSGLVPVGPGELFFHSNEWALATEHTVQRIPKQIRSGTQELVVRVRRACGVIIALACDGQSVPWTEDDSFACKLEAVGHSGDRIQQTACKESGNVPRFMVTAPGRYRLTLPPIPGHAPVEPFEIEIPPAQFITHTVELRRN